MHYGVLADQTGFQARETTEPSEHRRCLLCDRPLVPWLQVPGDWRRPELAARYRVGWCPGCAHGRLLSRLSSDELRAAYRIPYAPHAAPAPGRSVASPPRNIRSRFMDRLVGWRSGAPDIAESWVRSEFGSSPMDVCEIGCGSGRILEAFRASGHRVVGVEPGAAAREVAQHGGLEVIEGTAEALPDSLSRRRFDVVVMHHVLEHCEDPRTALENARRLMRPGAVLLLETPNNAAEGLRWAAAAWPWLDVPRHLQFFTAESLRRLCEISGLDVSRVEYRGYARQFQREWIESERRIADFVRARQGGVPRGAGSESARWMLLARTLFAEPRRRFDSVRVWARRSARSG